MWIYFRIVTRLLSVILLVAVMILIAFVIITPVTVSGALYLVGTVAVVIGILSVTWGYAKYRRVLWLGLGLIVTVAIVRLLLFTNSSQIRLLMLPQQNSLCIVNCIFDEQDVALFSTRLLSLIGWNSPGEQDGLLAAMFSGYRALAEVQPQVPSPFVRTYFQQQHPGAFDAIVIEPDDNQPIEMSVIFLHGFTGNFTMPCWLFAQAVQANHGVTVCPSVGWQGDWWTSNGEATLRVTIDYLHQRGMNRIYLAGLSNGAVGASELAYKLTDEIAGLILLSGASPNARDSGLPTLVLTGSHDERMPVDMMQAYANRMGDKATFIEFEADHFMLAKNNREVQDKLESWLRQH
jgi:pimeloyl-ACP methyl ester carboxylesterase